MSKKIDLCGEVFGRLTVLREDTANCDGYTRWICKCSCGVEKSIIGHSLRKKNGTRSCGCLVAENTRAAFKKRREASGARGSGFRRLFNRYRFGAKYKKRTWDLSEDDVARLTKMPCAYCGTEPQQVLERDGTPWVHNGLDRVDSRLGYEPTNVVACCRTCNTMKLDMTTGEFKKHIARVYLHSIAPQSLELAHG